MIPNTNVSRVNSIKLNIPKPSKSRMSNNTYYFTPGNMETIS